jgi:hypothetical protein
MLAQAERRPYTNGRGRYYMRASLSKSNVKRTRSALVRAITGSLTFSLAATARAEFPPLIDLATQNPSVSVTGASPADRSGFSLAAGDVNGDGRNELIVLAYWAHWTGPGSERVGEIDIIWGATFPEDGDLPLSQDSPEFARVLGTSTQAWYSSVTGDDFNGDGMFDIIWGQPFGPAQDFSSGDGVAYVIFGSSAFPDTLDIAAEPSQVTTIRGAQNGRGKLGLASCGCDLNGDGFDDIVLAAPEHWAEVFIVWGGVTFAPIYDMSVSPPGVTRISDTVYNTLLGMSLACSDFDRDGYDDLVLSSSGAPNSAEVTILYGRSQFPSSIEFPDLTYQMTRIYDPDPAGDSIAIGDHDGDGNLDLALANGIADPLGCYDCGEAYVVLNAASLPDSVWLEDTQPLRVIGTGDNTNYGIQLIFADITADSRDELVVVGRGDYNSPTSIDQTAVVYGASTPPDSILIGSDTTITRIRGSAHGVNLGDGVASADFNGDGVADLALGAERFQSNTGRTYVFFGCNEASDATPTMLPTLTLRQNYPNPFNPSTTISYSLPNSSRVRLVIYDVDGRRIATLLDKQQSAGDHIAQWDGRSANGTEVASGVYFCHLATNESSASMKIVLLR